MTAPYPAIARANHIACWTANAPTIQTRRLVLRPLALSDVPAIQRSYFNNWNIIKNLASVVPWPYPDDGAETLSGCNWEESPRVSKSISGCLRCDSASGEAIGSSIFVRAPTIQKGNRGFWLAEHYWNQD